MIKAGIIGAAGYTGGELIRLLLRHPQVTITMAHSRSQGGKPVASVHQDLLGDTELLFTDVFEETIDVLFLCAGHGEAKKFLQTQQVSPSVKVIDLSQDFRWKEHQVFRERAFVYGLPEANREAIAGSASLANPGCFATALQLGLLPLAAHGFAGAVYTTGITGATGAGQSLSDSSHFSWRTNNIQAYKSLAHQHIREVRETLSALHPEGIPPDIHFIPWRGDFARGIMVSQQLRTDYSLGALQKLYQTYYEGHPFTCLSSGPIHLKQVVNTNKCLIHIEQQGMQVVIHTVIDNLLKGASGQAVQNMNLMYGLPETAGLELKAGYF